MTNQLAAEKITVPADSALLPGDDVNGPFSAYAQAEIIKKHALAGSDGKTYAELGSLATQAKNSGDAELAAKYTAQRATVMNASFLRSSLFTSVLAYGVCFMAMGLGLMLALLGWALTRIAAALDGQPATAASASSRGATATTARAEV